jgi:hypothetical protein
MLNLHRAVQRSEFFELIGDFLLVGGLAEPRLELGIHLFLRLVELGPGLLQGGFTGGQALVQVCQLLFVPGQETLSFLLLRALGFFPLPAHGVELLVEAIHVRRQPVPIHRQLALSLPKGAQLPLSGSQLLSQAAHLSVMVGGVGRGLGFEGLQGAQKCLPLLEEIGKRQGRRRLVGHGRITALRSMAGGFQPMALARVGPSRSGR